MTEVIANAEQVVKEGHLISLAPIFLEPSQSNMSSEQYKKLSDLYDIAKSLDSEDPVGWIVDFNRSFLLDLEVIGETTRVGKILVMARLHKKKQGVKDKLKQARRDF